ncbi:MAG: hypothetical protein OXE94_07050 [Aestuariivita sp.]|nr:hypothetical protein [Aestuariivita sp.]MCY4202422.1 hypothetical protein [Aestuariivita sp.]MCY4345590.1 hypothetical protein [Aestuariivita sp.]
MSVNESIRKACKQELLFLMTPTLLSDPMVRHLYVSKEVKEYICRQTKVEAVRRGKLRRDFDRFIIGKRLSVSMNEYHHKDAYMARLSPADDEVWEIRSRAPKPGIRVFGRFAGKDRFVALCWRFRKDLGGADSRDFSKAVKGCKQIWEKILPNCDPLTGGNVDDYISKFTSI